MLKILIPISVHEKEFEQSQSNEIAAVLSLTLCDLAKSKLTLAFKLIPVSYISPKKSP